MDGLILVNKPQGLTSHDVVLRLRKIIGLRRVGHFGTLDPLATGLLLVGVGKATRLFPVLSKQDKAYSGRIRLGFATDTYDALGRLISSPKEDFPDEKELARAMARLSGTIEQLPPPYSAKKVEGKPLYKWARSKKMVELKPHRLTVYAFRLVSYVPPDLEVEVECSSGTYIRSLAHDLGRNLSCGAHLVSLCRTRVGNFHLADALSLEKIQELATRKKIQEFLIPLELLLEEWPKVILSDRMEHELGKGRPFPAEEVIKVYESKMAKPPLEPQEPLFRLFSLEGKLLGLARLGQEKRHFYPFLVFR